jgi:hypothetical protein
VPAGKVKQHLSAGPGERRNDGAYEIPITFSWLPSRKPMRRVAPQPPTEARRPHGRPADHDAQEHLMLDIAMLALGLGFFAAAVGYTYACERL